MFHFDENRRKTVLQMFDRTEESAEEDVKTIKKWLETQHHLPEIMEEAKIRNFLTMNKYSIERTKQKIDMYYTIRSVMPDMYEDTNPKSTIMKNFSPTTYCCTHLKTMDEFYRVFFFKPKEPNVLAPRELTMFFTNILEVRLYEDCMVGDIFFIDMEHLTMNDVLKCTPTMVAKCFGIYEKVYSIRMRALHYINSPPFIDVIIKIVRSILKPKIMNRIQVHQGTEVLKKFFSKEDLPKDYGGDGPSLQELHDMIEKKFEEYQYRFDQLDTLRVDEKLRPDKLDNDEVLGFYGNFKKLNVD